MRNIWIVARRELYAYFVSPIAYLIGGAFTFLCGLFFPIERLPVFLKPLAYALPLTYGADALHGAVHGGHAMPLALDLALLGGFCIALFAASLWNIQRKWIA